jgi:hypothetical protein
VKAGAPPIRRQLWDAFQVTRPQTLFYALTDSSVGQLGWIVEKFRVWTNLSAELPEDAANINVYWFTRTAHSSGNQ